MSDLQLSQLYIYPVKSLRGIALSSVELTGKGPKWDRRWMLVDPGGNFLSQRELGQMVLLQPQLETDYIRIQDLRGGREDLTVNLEPGEQAERLVVRIWNDTCPAVAVSEEADRWFSEALATDCRLVFMPDDSLRPLDPQYAKPGEFVSFADGYPYLVIGEASMTALNDRLETPIDIIRFRPNFVFSGGSPFEEDEWSAFTLGSARFRGTKPCVRCQIPTIDLTTGQASKEPTRTLATFRRQGNKILFGLNACWEPGHSSEKSEIRVGDVLQPLALRPAAIQ